ncbi:MAG: hypothetical protein H6Q15_2471 [Bacteroidetes bacterium]|nr:hypothetical protein [Bacteroidota bacterium]
MNQIYKKLLKNKIDQFITDFKSSKELFESLDNQNKLFHPGEFGLFRENICDELIKFTIPNKYNTGTGFLINSFDEISTQCDIVIYDLSNTPLIQDSSNNRFFPVESVLGIGEIKSKLTIKKLCEALVKLSKNKAIKKINQNNVFCVNKPNNNTFNPKVNCYDTIFSFLICDEIENFNYARINQEMNTFYKKNNIDYEFRHNFILSISDGVSMYKNQFNDIDPKISQNTPMYFPKYMDYEFENLHINNGNVENLTYFLTSLSNFLANVNIYYPEPNAYN